MIDKSLSTKTVISDLKIGHENRKSLKVDITCLLILDSITFILDPIHLCDYPYKLKGDGPYQVSIVSYPRLLLFTVYCVRKMAS